MRNANNDNGAAVYESVQVKKKYGKIMAYMLVDCTLATIAGIALLIMIICGQSKKILPGAENKKLGLLMVLALLAFGILGTWLITHILNKRTSKGERVKTWFRCYGAGWIVAFKMALCTTLFLIPMAFKMSYHMCGYSYAAEIDGFEVPLKKIGNGLYEDMHGNVYRHG